MVLHASNAALRKCSDPYKTLAGATKIKVLYISQALRTSSQTTSNRFRSLSYEAFHQDRARNWSLELPSLILEGSGALLGGSWPALERPRASLGSSWTLLGRSWARLRLSWASVGWSVAPLGCLFGVQGQPGPRFWEVLGPALLGCGGLQGHALNAFSCATHFVT